MTSPETGDFQTAHYGDLLVEVQIDAPVEKVWHELTAGMGSWWPNEFYAGGEEGKRSYTLEAEPGGRMYETWEGGGGVLWGHVATVDPGKTLQVVGYSFPNWGGPSLWYGTWELTAEGDGCKVRFEESTIGRVNEAVRADKTKGWKWLMGAAFKSHVEGKPCPPWVD